MSPSTGKRNKNIKLLLTSYGHRNDSSEVNVKSHVYYSGFIDILGGWGVWQELIDSSELTHNSTQTMSKPLATKMSTPLSENVQTGAKVSIFCVATITFQHCLNPLGHGVHQTFTGVLFHSSMMTSWSWWMLERPCAPPPYVWGCPTDYLYPQLL